MVWADIVIGHNTDKVVRALYGPGIFTEEGGHLGTRYFLAGDRSYTAEVTLGTDWRVESVSLSRGMQLPAGASSRKAVAPSLPKRVVLQGQLSLGSSKCDFVREFGKPANEVGDEVYFSPRVARPSNCVIGPVMIVKFVAGFADRITLYDGD